jgi:hypothetical protein
MLYADSTKGQGIMRNLGRKGKHNITKVNQHMPLLLRGRKSDHGSNSARYLLPPILGVVFTK